MNPTAGSIKSEKLLSITSELRRQLLKRPRGQQKTYLELLVKSALNKAIKGQDPRMIKEIIDRVDGLPTQKIQIDAELRISELAEQLRALTGLKPFIEATPAELVEEPNITSTQGDEAECPPQTTPQNAPGSTIAPQDDPEAVPAFIEQHKREIYDLAVYFAYNPEYYYRIIKPILNGG